MSSSETVVVRIFNTYGPRMRLNDGRALPAFIGQVLRNEDITVFGDGSQTRSFCYVSDAISAFFRLLFSEHNGMIYNVGNDEEVSVKEVAETIQKIMGKSINIRMVESNDPDYTKDNPQRRCPDLSLIKDSVKYIPKINLEDGLKRIYKWYMRE